MVFQLISRIVLFVLNAAVMLVSVLLAIIGGILAWGPHVLVDKIIEYTGIAEQLGQTAVDIPQLLTDFISPITRPIGIFLFFFGLVILLISILGFVGVTCRVKLLIKLYIIILCCIVVAHLILLIVLFVRIDLVTRKVEEKLTVLVTRYKSIQSKEHESIILSILMGVLQCCGVRNGEEFKHTNMDATDKCFGQTFTDLKYPLTCCKLTESFQLVDPKCPGNFNENNSNIKVGCLTLLETQLQKIVKILAYISIIILLFNIAIIMIAVCAI